VDYPALLADVEKRIAQAERRPSFWLRASAADHRARRSERSRASSRSVSRRDIGESRALRDRTVALGSLLVLAVHSLRPLHRPPLAGWARIATVVLTPIATPVSAFLRTRSADRGRE
jgi:hypothetical protein